jgi:hypothetical protein
MLPEGDFALGLRTNAADADEAFAHGDFATGQRAGTHSLAIGTFAMGQATRPPSVIRGHFATGQSSRSLRIRIPHPRLHRHEHGQSPLGIPGTEAGLS